MDEISKKFQTSIRHKKFQALVGETDFEGEKIILMKPQTYMNLSGEAVLEILQYYKLSPQDLIVIYDDIDLELGKIRIRPSGSAGTHNGMRNIVEQIKSTDFTRIRMGTGLSVEGIELKDFVLLPLAKEEKDAMQNMAQRVSDAVLTILKQGIYSSLRLIQ